MKVKIRKAKKPDFEIIINLIVELAKFEKLSPPGEKAKKKAL
jgi:hypothetical protein